MKVGDWIRVIDGYWKGGKGEVFVANDRFVWVRLLDGEEAICLSHQIEPLPVLGQRSLLKEQS